MGIFGNKNSKKLEEYEKKMNVTITKIDFSEGSKSKSACLTKKNALAVKCA